MRPVLILAACAAILPVAACGPSSDDSSSGTKSALEQYKQDTGRTGSPTSSPAGGAIHVNVPAPTAHSPLPATMTVDSLIATASYVAGPKAWAHTRTAQIIGPSVTLATDWTSPSAVDPALANQLCAGIYSWIQELGPGVRVTIGALYSSEGDGPEVFACT